MLLWQLNLGVPLVGTTTLVIRGFQSGLLVTRGLGVYVVVSPVSCYPDPFLATATAAIDPFSATSVGAPDPFQAVSTTMIDPFQATSRLKC